MLLASHTSCIHRTTMPRVWVQPTSLPALHRRRDWPGHLHHREFTNEKQAHTVVLNESTCGSHHARLSFGCSFSFSLSCRCALLDEEAREEKRQAVQCMPLYLRYRARHDVRTTGSKINAEPPLLCGPFQSIPHWQQWVKCLVLVGEAKLFPTMVLEHRWKVSRMIGKLACIARTGKV